MPRGRAGDDGAATSDGQTLSPARGLSRALRAAAPTLERRRSTKGRSGTVYEGIGVNRATATLSDAAVVSLDEAMVGQSALAWTFEQDGFEEAYQWEASLEDGPAFNSGSLSEDTANHEAAERRFSFEADKPPVPPKEVAVTGGMADSSWTSATTSHKRSSSDIAYLAHSESTILNPGGSLPRISSAARFHGATRPSPSFGSAQPERKSPESPNDPAALDSDGVSQLRYRLVECEKQLELERERRLMLDG